MKLTLAKGVVMVLQLDESANQDFYGITEMTWLSKSIRFKITPLGHVRLRYALRDRAEGAAGMYDQPRGYTLSARAALRQIERQEKA